MSKPKQAAPVGEIQAWLRDMAARPAQYQAASIDHQIPTDTKNQSGIEARRFTALVQAATTDLEAARHLADAIAHWKDFMLFDEALLGQKYRSEQAGRRKGKGTLTLIQKKHIQDGYKQRVQRGEKYGAIREFAVAYRVSESTIKTILKAAK